MNRFLVFFFAFSIFGSANAIVNEFQLQQLVGWTIFASKTIVGHVKKDGKKSDSFEGCDFGTTVIFDDDTAITCSYFSYQYAYRPTAILFGKSVQIAGKSIIILKMLVNGQIYDVQ